MEEKPKTNQVMDIQPPKQPEVTPLQPQQRVANGSIEDSLELDFADVQEAPAEEKATNEQTSSVRADAPILAATAQPAHKNHVPVMAIISALVVSGAIAALTVYSFTSSDKPKDTTASQSDVSPTPTTKAATSSDVETLNSTIDQDLSSIDETADYNDTSVNDTSLGL